MKIAVLNGSPKGMTSTTMEYVQFIQRSFPDHELKITSIHLKTKRMEKDDDDKVFWGVLNEIKASDAVLWAFPCYYMNVPGYYKRFLELIWEKQGEDFFKGKHAAILCTSIKFFDHAAINYMHAICDDLGMKYNGFFSPEMYFLAEKEGQRQTLLFAENFFADIQNDRALQRSYPPVNWSWHEYKPSVVKKPISTMNKKVLILTDSDGTNANLDRMIERFQVSFTEKIDVLNIRDVKTQGPCLGCIKCFYDHKCVYKDDFAKIMDEVILKADILVFSGELKDRFVSSHWKIWLDRSFCKGHVPWLSDKQIGFIVSGPLRQNPNIEEIFQVFFEYMQANFLGFVTDEFGDAADIDSSLEGMAQRLVSYADRKYMKPQTFLGTATNLSMREVFSGRFSYPFVADYNEYFRSLLRGCPNVQYKTRLQNKMLSLLSYFPAFRRYAKKNFKQLLLKPLAKVPRN